MAWWKERGCATLAKDIFPTDGAVAYFDSRPVAMAFLYICRDGRLAMIEWTSTNPASDISARAKLQGVKALWEQLEMEARLMGCLCVLSMVTPNGSEEHLMGKMGWFVAPNQTPHVMCAKRLRE